jgi:hypothetical protein
VNISTSPEALSAPASSLKLIKPLRPLEAPWYSPDHSPTSCETSLPDT